MRSSRFLVLMAVSGSVMAAGLARAQAPVGTAPGQAAPMPTPTPAAPAPYAPPAAPAPMAPAQYPPGVAPAPFVGPPNAEAERGAIATGFMVQARMQAQSSLLSIGGGPGFLVGYRGSSFALGVGLGLTRVGVSSRDSGTGSASVTLLQIVPTLLLDVWRSADGRARANLVGGLGYERASASVTTDRQSCLFDSASGRTICSTSSSTDTAGATLIPIMVGVGGDYFFSRNFALGAEAGLQAAFLTSVDSQSDNRSETLDTTGDMEFAYGVIRATMVLGD